MYRRNNEFISHARQFTNMHEMREIKTKLLLNMLIFLCYLLLFLAFSVCLLKGSEKQDHLNACFIY